MVFSNYISWYFSIGSLKIGHYPTKYRKNILCFREEWNLKLRKFYTDIIKWICVNYGQETEGGVQPKLMGHRHEVKLLGFLA